MPAKLNYKKYIGCQFGHLLIISEAHEQNSDRRYMANCHCLLCGNKIIKSFKEIINGHTRSCGCLRKKFGGRMEKELSGHRYGRLTVINKTDMREDGRTVWICLCDCGNYKRVRSSSLIRGNTQSCGCIHKEITSDTGKKTGPIYGKLNGRKLKGRFARENSPHWLGGKSFEPYSLEWDKDLKQKIKTEWSNRCALCGSVKNHHVHHIDYDKKNCKISNLILLCNSCHTKTNYNRDKWEKYFEEVKSERSPSSNR